MVAVVRGQAARADSAAVLSGARLFLDSRSDPGAGYCGLGCSDTSCGVVIVAPARGGVP